RYAMDTTRIQRDLGWEPEETLATGLAKTVDWVLANQDWLAAIAEEKDLAGWMRLQYDDPDVSFRLGTEADPATDTPRV
ncbi:MAG: hypothetical protein AAF791_12110, partial [Bacteroidota bacterium]